MVTRSSPTSTPTNSTAFSWADPAIVKQRKTAWDKVVAANGGVHPNCGDADTRPLRPARLTAVPAARGAGLHPNREVWGRNPREAARSGFVPKNKHRPDAARAF
jgi:dihydroxy-acid dehydratase